MKNSIKKGAGPTLSDNQNVCKDGNLTDERTSLVGLFAWLTSNKKSYYFIVKSLFCILLQLNVNMAEGI